MKKQDKYLGIAAVIAAIILFFRNKAVGEPPLPPGGVEPPTIPPQSTYQLRAVRFDSDDVGITTLGNWKVLLGIAPHNISPNITIHIVVKDPSGAEVAHLMNQTLMPQDNNFQYKTYGVSGSITGLSRCTVYTAFCWVTDVPETVSYFPLQSGGWITRGCP